MPPDLLAALPPRLRVVAERALRFPEEVHTDSCLWMGGDSPRPCTCRVPALMEWLIAEFGLDDAVSE